MNNNKALHLLRDGFKQEFAEYVFQSAAFSDLLMELSDAFVEDNIPLVGDQDAHDLSLLLYESIKLENY